MGSICVWTHVLTAGDLGLCDAVDEPEPPRVGAGRGWKQRRVELAPWRQAAGADAARRCGASAGGSRCADLGAAVMGVARALGRPVRVRDLRVHRLL
jgi:hypothetical protein